VRIRVSGGFMGSERIVMIVYPQVALWILVVTAVTLFWVALTDLREFRIPNELVLALVGLYVLYALVSGHWVTMRWNIGFALLMLAGMIYAYWQQQMGGGDLKLLVAAFLWTGPGMPSFLQFCCSFSSASIMPPCDSAGQRLSYRGRGCAFRWPRRWRRR
jgi:Flp pilus assembly protein protease CpaA